MYSGSRSIGAAAALSRSRSLLGSRSLSCANRLAVPRRQSSTSCFDVHGLTYAKAANRRGIRHPLHVRQLHGVGVASCVLAAFLAGCSSGSRDTPTPSPSPPRSAAALPAVVANCEKPSTKPRQEPHRIVAACGGDGVFILGHIHYADWGTRSATGTARLKYNSCQPYCAAGHLVSAKARLRLDRPRQEQGHLVFTTVVVHSHSGPDGRYPLGGSQIRH